jgi:hypothetical protein
MRKHFLLSINRAESAITGLINSYIVVYTMIEFFLKCIIS